MILQKSIIIFIILLLLSMIIHDIADCYIGNTKRREFRETVLVLWEQRYRAVSLACAIGLLYMIAR